MATIWRVEKLYCEVLNQQDGTVIAHWQFDTGTTTDKFDVWWEYWNTTTKTWVLYQSSTSSDKWERYKSGEWFQNVWTPDDAPTSTHVRCYVRPWATRDSNGNLRWTSGGAYTKSIPNPKWENLNAEFKEPPELDLDYYESGSFRFSWSTPPVLAKHIVIYRQEDGAGDYKKFKTYSVSANHPSITLAVGKRYRFKARWSIDSNAKTLSNASLATESVFGRPARPTKLACSMVSCNAESGSVKLSWLDSGKSGDGYHIEYADHSDAWSGHSSDIQEDDSYTGAPNAKGENWCTIAGLEPGKKYWFRLKRTESRAEEHYAQSYYAEVKANAYTVACRVGTTPTAPTLGLVAASVDVDTPLLLSWTHNCEDGSPQTAYQLQTKVGSGSWASRSTGTTMSSYTFTPSAIASDGNTVYWRVRTKGGMDTGGNSDWSPWSATGKFVAYANPSPTIAVDDMESYPLEISIATPTTGAANAAERCVCQILAAEDHEYVGPDGETRYVAQGDVVWSNEHVFGDTTEYELSLMPQDVIFHQGITYTVTATVITRLGMVGSAEPADFVCDVTMADITGCDCEATFDPQSLASTVHPLCTDGPGGQLRDGLTLSVWRVTPDGTELVAEGMPNDGAALCVDPHPTFGSCTYRVVALDEATGSVGFADATFGWKGPGIVIQWDETFEEPSNDMDGVAFSGHRIVLPYNIDVSEQWDKESSLNEWAGRKHPVSRYGTQRGHTATWSCDIPKFGGLTQTNEVRLLAAHMGDCHVREPYGSGYTAHVQVSGVSYANTDGAVHVSLAVTRVEE